MSALTAKHPIRSSRSWALRLLRLIECSAGGTQSVELAAQRQHVDDRTWHFPDPVIGTSFQTALNAYAEALHVEEWGGITPPEVLMILAAVPSSTPDALGHLLRQAVDDRSAAQHQNAGLNAP